MKFKVLSLLFFWSLLGSQNTLAQSIARIVDLVPPTFEEELEILNLYIDNVCKGPANGAQFDRFIEAVSGHYGSAFSSIQTFGGGIKYSSKQRGTSIEVTVGGLYVLQINVNSPYIESQFQSDKLLPDRMGIRLSPSACSPERVEIDSFWPKGNLKETTIFRENGLVEVSHFVSGVNPAISPLSNIYGQDGKQYASYLRAPKVKIGIIDMGVDYNHPEIAYKFDREDVGYDFAQEDKWPYDTFDSEAKWHGTHVAGIVANKNENIQLFAYRYAAAPSRQYQWKKIFRHASERDIKIMNLSISLVDDGDICEAMSIFPDIIFVVAAGNFPSELHEYSHKPATCVGANVLKVSNIAENDDVLGNYGNMVQLAAIGNTLSLQANGDDPVILNGSSQAAPKVTRALSFILAENPKMSPPEVIEKLKLEHCIPSPELSKKFAWGCQLDE